MLRPRWPADALGGEHLSEATFECNGPEDVARILQELAAAVPEEVANALYREGEVIMNDSKRMTPVDTGYLRASGYVNDPTISPDAIEVQLGYWANYAVYVHDLPYNHVNGSPRFLEMALDDRTPGMGRRIIDRVMARMGVR